MLSLEITYTTTHIAQQIIEIIYHITPIPHIRNETLLNPIYKHK